MTITIDYKGAHGQMDVAIANAVGCNWFDVEVIVTPAKTLIPFCADWRIVNSCADMVVKIKGEYLLLNII